MAGPLDLIAATGKTAPPEPTAPSNPLDMIAGPAPKPQPDDPAADVHQHLVIGPNGPAGMADDTPQAKQENETYGAMAQHFLGDTLNAFGQGWHSVIGDTPLGQGYTPEIQQGLAKAGYDLNATKSVSMAAWRAIMVPAAGVLDIAVRAPQALYKGAQEAGMAAGLAPDVVSIPDAFMGSPHMFHVEPPVAGVIPSEIAKFDANGAPITEAPKGPTRSQMSVTGDPAIDGILKSPTTSAVIDNPVVDRSHSVPYTAGGSVPLNDPTVYIDHRFPKEIEAPSVSDPARTVKFDPAEPFTVHENVEQHTMERLTKGGMDDGAAYRVAHYEFAEKAEGAWYRTHDIDQTAAEKIYAPLMDRIARESAVGYKLTVAPEGSAMENDFTPGVNGTFSPAIRVEGKVYRESDAWKSDAERTHGPPVEDAVRIHGEDAVNAAMEADGVGYAEKDGTFHNFMPGEAVSEEHAALLRPGDAARVRRPFRVGGEAARVQGGIPANLYEKPYPHDDAHLANGPDAIDHKPTVEEIAQARKILGGDSDAPRVTGGPLDNPDLARARDAGLIGHDAIAEALGLGPKEAADRMVPASAIDHGSPVHRDVLANGDGRIVKPGELPDDEFYGVRIHGDHPGAENINDLPAEDVSITHKNGVPVERARVMASDAGVPKDETISEPAGGRQATDKAGNIRMDLIDRPGAVLDVMRKAAEENGGEAAFAAARRGEIPLGQREAIAEVMGVDPKTLDIEGLGRKLTNDGMVRTYIQAMIQSAEDVAGKAKQASLTGADADLIAFQEARMRHSVIQEQVAGLTAEWGRTGNVFQEFGEGVKDARSLGEFLRAKKGEGMENLEDLRKMVKDISTMDPRTQVPKFMADARTPGFFDKLFWYRNNSLISGWVTHSKYVLVNSSWMLWNSLVVKQGAALAGDVRSLSGALGLTDRDIDRVYHGESAAAVAGMVRAFPTSIIAAAKAIRDGVAPKLEGEAIAKGSGVSSGIGNPFESVPMRAFGEVVGVPGRIVTGIHTFYLTLGQRMSLEAQAYRAAAKEGAKPWTMDFWDRQADRSKNATPEMLDQSIKDAYYGAFMQPLGEKGQAVSRAIGQTPLRWLIPFRHVPGNLLKAGQEMTPLAVMSEPMRDDLMGKNGGVAQDTQIARVAIGSALGGYVVHSVLSGNMTGDGPVDPKQRAEWLLSHQPNSIRIGNKWVSYARFGPVGDVMGVFANIGEIAPHIKDGEYTTAIAMGVVAGGRWITDGAGLLGLADAFDLMRQPERRGASIVANFAGGFKPYSSALNQTAAALDPNMRDTRSFVDGLKLGIPGSAWGYGRESLPVRRDWLGNPMANPMQGLLPPTLLRTSPVNQDPVNAEMQRLDINPTLPERMINKVKLSPQAYDRYQVLAGAPLSQALHSMVGQPNWFQLPDQTRQTLIEGQIKSNRERAATAMKMENFSTLVQDPMQLKLDRLSGKAPPK